MATQHIIAATSRQDQGKGASRRLRRTGQVPAVVYGGHQDPVSVQLSHNTLFLASQHEWFYSTILDLEIEGAMEKVVLRDMQRHPAKPQILHVDFQRITAGEAMVFSVPLHFLNQEKSPAGKASDIVITHDLNEVEISCLPKDLPEFIAVDLSTLAEGDVVHLSQLVLPDGVTIPELRFGKEHDLAVATARHARVEADSEGGAEGEDAEVPEAK